jgi:chloramphenicol 3-O-phosphotransferase
MGNALAQVKTQHAIPAKPAQQRVVILNGPPGVGKTTTGRVLAGRFADAACIHGDDLKNFIVRRTPAVRGQLGYRNGASIATNFVEAGYQMVIFEYVFESSDGVAAFLDAYRGTAPVHLFTLWAPLSTVVARERARTGRRPLGDQVSASYGAIERNLHDLGDVIDTTTSTPATVADAIAARCRRGRSVISTPAIARDAA